MAPYYTEADLDRLSEQSKNDRHKVVGSEVRALIMDVREARAAMLPLHSQIVEWMPGGAQGVTMPVLQMNARLLVAGNNGRVVEASLISGESDVFSVRDDDRFSERCEWRDVNWYIQSSALTPPPNVNKAR